FRVGLSLEVEARLSLHSLLECRGDGFGKRRVHIERHEVEAHVRLAQTHTAKVHGLSLVLRQRRRPLGEQGVLNGRIHLHRESFDVLSKNRFQCGKYCFKIWVHRVKFTSSSPPQATTERLTTGGATNRSS